MIPELSAMTLGKGVEINALIESFYCQLMAFSEYINENPQVVQTERYADFVLYCLTARLHASMDEQGIKYPKIAI